MAFRAYVPSEPNAILIFYHGAGAHSEISYQHISNDLRDVFQVGVYTPDIRGYGCSEGPRGDAPRKELVWQDITVQLNHVRSLCPSTPVSLGGHSAGAGLVLSYSSWKDSQPVNGYVFIALYLGFRSKTEHTNNNISKYQFSTVKNSKFIVNYISLGMLFNHSKAVEFLFSTSIIKSYPKIVTYNTVIISYSVTPHSQFQKLNRFGLWIGEKDEIFDSKKIVDFAKINSHNDTDIKVQTLSDVTHLSIIKTHPILLGNGYRIK